MPKARPPYAPEFRRQMVDLVRVGRDPADLAGEFEPSAQAIRDWVAQADRHPRTRLGPRCTGSGGYLVRLAERGENPR